MHYVIKGMHWGIRRFQPYSDGEHGRFARRKQAKRGARLIADITQRERNQEVRKIKAKKKSGDISGKEFRAKRKVINAQYKAKNQKEIKKFVDQIKASKSYKQAQKRVSDVSKKAYKDIPNYSLKRGLNTANKVLTGATGGYAAADIGATALMIGAGLVPASFGIPVAAAGAAGYAIGTTAGYKIRKKILEKNM